MSYTSDDENFLTRNDETPGKTFTPGGVYTLDEMVSKIDELNAALASSKGANARLQNELDTRKEDYHRRSIKLANEAEALRKDLESQLAIVKDCFEKERNNVQKYSKIVDELHEEINQLRQENAEHDDDLDSAAAELNQKDAEIVQLQMDNARLAYHKNVLITALGQAQKQWKE